MLATDAEHGHRGGDRRKELAAMNATEAQEQTNVANFDDLDFRVYSGQKSDEFTKSHARISSCTG